MWSVRSDTEQALERVLKDPQPSVPPKEQKIGSSIVTWWEGKPGDAVVMAEGGSPEDRMLAEQMVVAQLERVGYKRAQFTFESEHKEAGWPDIMEKAKRLIQSGAVTILRNGYNNIVGHVKGDHGEYQSEIGREDPESRTITTWQCFLEDAPITMSNGTRKRIDEIESGDRVISHTGRICNVSKQWSRPYRGRIAVIKLQGIDEVITLTDNHPLWAANHDYYLQDSAGWRGRIKLGEGPVTPEVGWKEAQKLVTGDYLSMAQFTERLPHCVEIEGIPIDEDIATLLGWYAAEGYVVKSNKNQVGFNLHLDERPVAEMLSKITADKFGDAGHIRTMRWPSDPDRMEMVEFRVSNSNLRLLVESAIGIGSASKGIHHVLLGAPENVQRAFLDAYIAGDGYIDGNRTGIHTVSEKMAHALRVLLTRLGHPSSILYEDDNDGNGFVKNWRRIYRVRWATGSKRDPARFMRDGNAWFKVESVDFYDYEGRVYDLEVADDHSFQAFGVNVHNCECPWDQYAWQRTRKWKKYEGRPCAHVMALYWKSLATPLDDYDPQQHGPMGTGQKMGPPPSQGPSLPTGPGAPKPEAPSTPSPVETPSPAGLAPPGEPGVLPTPPMDQLAEQMPPVPGQTPAGMPANPNIVSVPGAKMPTPFNPIQFPGGTYSATNPIQIIQTTVPEESLGDAGNFDGSVRQPFIYHVPSRTIYLGEPGMHHDEVAWTNEFAPASKEYESAFPESHPDYFQGEINHTPYGKALGYGGFDNAPDGPDVYAALQAIHPDLEAPVVRGKRIGSAPEEPPNYREGTAEEHCGNCKMLFKSHCWGYGNKEVGSNMVCDSWYPEGKLSHRTAAEEFVAPEIVRLKNDVYGMAEGKSEAHGAGQYQNVPAGRTGEVLGQDPSTGWVEIIIPLDESSYLEPYFVRCFVEPSDIEHTTHQPPGPFIKRRS